MTNPGSGNLMLLHCLKQRGLRLGRCPIDFVRQYNIGEYRATNEGHLPSFACVLQNLGPGDISRHEVGRELNALKLEVKNPGDGFYQERLGKARRAGNQAMASCEKSDQELLDYLFLPDDDLRQFGLNSRSTSRQAFNNFAFRLGRGDSVLSFWFCDSVH